MTFEELKSFIAQDMSMRHIYQPVMLIELLKGGGKASIRDIAQAILNHDPTQVEYYSEVVKNMVGKVLSQNRGITEREKDAYLLKNADQLNEDEKAELISLCESKIADYEVKRNGEHWEHRKRGRAPISGSIRYEVLKRSKFRCDLCGITADKRSLEVDHIHPKSLGGKDDISNYQSLCYLCNTQKNNRDSSDFRNHEHFYDLRSEGCLFCDLQVNDRTRIVDENELAYTIRDGFAVTPYHSLFIPKRHAADYFELTQPEINAISQLIQKQKVALQKLDSTIDAFNIGMNCGEAAGQTVFHCHVHLIPRRKGDVEDPRGGIRHVIPGKGHYQVKK